MTTTEYEDVRKAEEILGRRPDLILNRIEGHLLRRGISEATWNILMNAEHDIENDTLPTPWDIRKDEKIGVGTCSTWDECYENSELLDRIRELAEDSYEPITGKAAIIAEMRRVSEAVLERMAERDAECGW